jgi:hypothetical protein
MLFVFKVRVLVGEKRLLPGIGYYVVIYVKLKCLVNLLSIALENNLEKLGRGQRFWGSL